MPTPAPLDERRQRELATLVTIHRRLADQLGRLHAKRSAIATSRMQRLEEKALRRERLARLVDNRIRLAAELLSHEGREGR